MQGNLDPTLVFAPTDVMTARAAEIIEAGRAARGHIFNLGHGVIPSTDPDQLSRLTEFVQGYDDQPDLDGSPSSPARAWRPSWAAGGWAAAMRTQIGPLTVSLSRTST